MYRNKAPTHPAARWNQPPALAPPSWAPLMIIKNCCITNRTKLQNSRYSNSPFIRHSDLRQLPNNGIYFRIAIYTPTRTKLVVLRPFERPGDSDHCAVCTLLLERFCKCSVLHTYVWWPTNTQWQICSIMFRSCCDLIRVSFNKNASSIQITEQKCMLKPLDTTFDTVLNLHGYSPV